MLGRNPKLLGSHLLGNGPELGLGLTLSRPKLLRLSKLLLLRLRDQLLLTLQILGCLLLEGMELSEVLFKGIGVKLGGQVLLELKLAALNTGLLGPCLRLA